MSKKQKKSNSACSIKCALSNCANKNIIIFIIIIFIIIAMIATAKNNDRQPNASVINKTENKTRASNIKNSADKIEVYYFHRTQRCYSCNILSQYTREIIERKFSEEIKNGKIEFREVNVDLPENKDIALKFQASGSSLFINAIKDGQNDISQDTSVWRLLGNKSQFENYLTNKMNLLLGK